MTFLAISLLATGCGKRSPPDDSEVALLIQERIAKDVHWNQKSEPNKQITCCIEHLLKQDLQKEAAIQIALLNNPEIQATFEKLGIAHADLIRAGLFQNPVFQGFVSVPAESSSFSVSQGFLDIFMIPLRKKVAETEFEQAKLFVANAILDLAFTVQETYYSLQAKQSQLDLLMLLLDANEARYLLAKGQKDAGNISNLTLQMYKSQYLEAKTDLATSQNEIALLRMQLNNQLGLKASLANWKIPNTLPHIPKETLVIESLETAALAERFDIAHARLEIRRLTQMAKTKKWWAFTDATIGIEGENSHIGPTASLNLPFFNHGQADQNRLAAMLRQSQQHLKALELNALSHVRSLYNQLDINRSRVLLYENEFLPEKTTLLATAQSHYNVMALSAYTLIETKQSELEAQIEYKIALKDYWLTRVALERAVGGNIK